MEFAPNFSLRELTTTTMPFDNTPSRNNLGNLCALSFKLQELRDAMLLPLYINSAFRSPQVNRAVGGAAKSYHLYGRAADISIRNLNKEQRQRLEHLIIESRPVEFIKYDTFYHVAYDFSKLGTQTNKPVTWQEEFPDEFPAVSTPGRRLDY